jgi:hypothetical protein
MKIRNTVFLLSAISIISFSASNAASATEVIKPAVVAPKKQVTQAVSKKPLTQEEKNFLQKCAKKDFLATYIYKGKTARYVINGMSGLGRLALYYIGARLLINTNDEQMDENHKKLFLGGCFALPLLASVDELIGLWRQKDGNFDGLVGGASGVLTYKFFSKIFLRDVVLLKRTVHAFIETPGKFPEEAKPILEAVKGKLSDLPAEQITSICEQLRAITKY